MQALSEVSMPPGTFTLLAGMFTLPAMNESPHLRPIHAIRWRNFRRLLEQRSLTITAAAALLDKSQGHVSHFGGKKPSKIIGDEMAADIETSLALPTGWLDVEGGSAEPFSFDAESSHSNEVRQSYAARLDMDILSEAVKVITADEAHNGMYSFPRHAEVLMQLYDKLAAGEDAMSLAIQITQQRNLGSENGRDAAGTSAR